MGEYDYRLSPQAKEKFEDLTSHQQKGEKLAKLKKLYMGLCVAFFVILAFFTKGIALIFAIAGPIVIHFLVEKKRNELFSYYRDNYERVIGEIFGEHIDNFKHMKSPDDVRLRIIEENRFVDTGKGEEKCTYFGGMSGTYRGLDFVSSSYFHMHIKEKRNGEKSIRKYENGIGAETKLNTPFDGELLIRRGVNWLFGDFPTVELDNVDFNKAFNVGCNDKNKAYFYLDFAKMEKLLKLAETFDNIAIYISGDLASIFVNTNNYDYNYINYSSAASANEFFYLSKPSQFKKFNRCYEERMKMLDTFVDFLEVGDETFKTDY